MRLDKFLADVSLGSRNDVKQLIKKKCIMVNGKICTSPDTKINEYSDTVTYNGEILSYQKFHYYMLHKPAGVITATKDSACTTVMDLLKDVKTKNLSPVGRLDKDTEGLLLITDDGMLAHKLLSPAHHVPKQYFARINGIVTNEHISLFKAGLDIGDDKPTKPAVLEILSVDTKGQTSEILLTITEGRFHQVKRMFEAVEMSVTYLKRLSMGSLTLDSSLAPGSYRPLTDKEINEL
jgi:16S rRNA pseudouridine516 synthase